MKLVDVWFRMALVSGWFLIGVQLTGVDDDLSHAWSLAMWAAFAVAGVLIFRFVRRVPA